MFRALRTYFIALVCVWLALGVAAYEYAQRISPSHWIMTGLAAAFAVEAVFYLGMGFEAARAAFARIPSRPLQSVILVASALAPYAIATASGGTFNLRAFAVLAGISAVVAFWHVVLPRRIAYDAGFLVIVAAVIILRVFPHLYVSPAPRLRIDILGHLMWIRLTITVMIVQREWDAGPVTFWPNGAEWRAGTLYFALAALPLFGCGWALHYIRFAPKQLPGLEWAGLAVATFAGILCVTAVGEEFFFRGVLTRALFDWRRSAVVAVLVSSAVFGAAHLWYRAYPNWQFALLAAIAGCFYALAYLRGGSIRASMVAHALVVTVWKMLFA